MPSYSSSLLAPPLPAKMYFSAGSKMFSLKRQCHKIFCFRFFSWIIFPQAPENKVRVISIFFENSRRYSKVKVHHRYQRHGWQMMDTISGCWHLKVTLKEKSYLYVNSTTQRCSKKIIKTFLIEDFFHLPPVSTTPVAHLELRISPRIFEKIHNGPNGILRVLEETDSWKKPDSKNSWHCPFSSEQEIQEVCW